MKTPEQYIVEAFARARLNGLRIIRVTECKNGVCVAAFVVYRKITSAAVGPGSGVRLGRRQGAKALFEFVSKLTRSQDTFSAAP